MVYGLVLSAEKHEATEPEKRERSWFWDCSVFDVEYWAVVEVCVVK